MKTLLSITILLYCFYSGAEHTSGASDIVYETTDDIVYSTSMSGIKHGYSAAIYTEDDVTTPFNGNHILKNRSKSKPKTGSYQRVYTACTPPSPEDIIALAKGQKTDKDLTETWDRNMVIRFTGESFTITNQNVLSACSTRLNCNSSNKYSGSAVFNSNNGTVVLKADKEQYPYLPGNSWGFDRYHNWNYSIFGAGGQLVVMQTNTEVCPTPSVASIVLKRINDK